METINIVWEWIEVVMVGGTVLGFLGLLVALLILLIKEIKEW